jgi:hypothetical protein
MKLNEDAIIQTAKENLEFLKKNLSKYNPIINFFLFHNKKKSYSNINELTPEKDFVLINRIMRHIEMAQQKTPNISKNFGSIQHPIASQLEEKNDKKSLMYAIATNLAKYKKPQTPKNAKPKKLSKSEKISKEKNIMKLKKSLKENISNEDVIKITLSQILIYKEKIYKDSSLDKYSRHLFIEMLKTLEKTLTYNKNLEEKISNPNPDIVKAMMNNKRDLVKRYANKAEEVIYKRASKLKENEDDNKRIHLLSGIKIFMYGFGGKENYEKIQSILSSENISFEKKTFKKSSSTTPITGLAISPNIDKKGINKMQKYKNSVAILKSILKDFPQIKYKEMPSL